MLAKLLPALGLFCIVFVPPPLAGSEPATVALLSVTADNKARLGYINRQDNAVKLELTDQSGAQVFVQKVDKMANLFLVLDLTPLPEGIYTLNAGNKDPNPLKAFRKTGSQVAVIDLAKELPPQIFRAADLLQIIYPNTLAVDMRITIEANGIVFFEDQDNSRSTLHKKYSLKELPNGNYQLRLHTPFKEYTFAIELK